MQNKFVIIGNSAERMETFFDEISTELSLRTFNGIIIFDCLLSNGNSSRRYFTALFSDNQIVRKSIKIISDVEQPIKAFTQEYFLKNRSILNKGILTQHEIKRLLSVVEHEYEH